MEKGMLSVPETTERLSVSGFTVVWLIKADEPKAQRMTTRKAPAPSLKRRYAVGVAVLQCCTQG